jgi:hypothetical protein
MTMLQLSELIAHLEKSLEGKGTEFETHRRKYNIRFQRAGETGGPVAGKVEEKGEGKEDE